MASGGEGSLMPPKFVSFSSSVHPGKTFRVLWSFSTLITSVIFTGIMTQNLDVESVSASLNLFFCYSILYSTVL